jgi:hypothetical protein
MEVIDLDSVNLNENNSDPVISLNTSTPSLAGAELLMNQSGKKRSEEGNNNSDIESLDMSTLEKELNELTNNTNTVNMSSSDEPTIKINIAEEIKEPENLASVNLASNNSEPVKNPSIKKMGDTEKTWDGYKQFNNIPLNPDKPVNTQPKKSREEILKEKFNYLRKLEAIERKGARLSKQYTMDSSLEEMIGEYETIKSEKEKSNSVKFQGRMLMAAVTGLEFLNNRFDPFDFKLDGWSEQVNENIDDYDEIFGELHEKYSSKAKMAPELKLLFQLSGSAIMLHMTNTMFKSSMPGMDDILRQNPELMQQFTKAAVNQMSDEKPGFGNFMNGMMNDNMSSQSRRAPSPPPPSMSAPPPAPLKTSNNGKMDNFTRPDIGFGRGGPEPGINVKNNMESANKPERSPRTRRPEMKGPSSDIDALLSGLKPKTSSPLASKSETASTSTTKKVGLASTNSSSKKRRAISEKNTISLDY